MSSLSSSMVVIIFIVVLVPLSICTFIMTAWCSFSPSKMTITCKCIVFRLFVLLIIWYCILTLVGLGQPMIVMCLRRASYIKNSNLGNTRDSSWLTAPMLYATIWWHPYMNLNLKLKTGNVEFTLYVIIF